MTILEHFKTFEQPYKDQAIANLYPNMAGRQMTNDYEALIVGFYWNDTPEKFNYWEKFCNKLKQRHK